MLYVLHKEEKTNFFGYHDENSEKEKQGRKELTYPHL